MAFIICCITITWLIAGVLYFGNKTNGYSLVTHTISELGETGSRYEKQVGFGLFLPVGILLLLIAFLAKENINAMGLALTMATGYIVSAFFPCDPGSPVSGSWKQQIHNMGGLIEYAGSLIFIMKAAENDLYLWLIPFKTIGYGVIVLIIITSIPKNKFRGLAQRIAELLLIVCLLKQFY